MLMQLALQNPAMFFMLTVCGRAVFSMAVLVYRNYHGYGFLGELPDELFKSRVNGVSGQCFRANGRVDRL
jgi:hypothetical protein